MSISTIFGQGLAHRVSILVPSTKNVDQPMSQEDHNSTVDSLLTQFSELFGGASAQSLLGGYVAHNEQLVKEVITEVYSFCESLSDESLETVKGISQTLAQTLTQESIAVIVDQTMFFVS
jgi:hypothetical protein